MIPNARSLERARGSEVCAAIGDALLDEAQRIRGLEEVMRPGAWNESRAQAHHAICAAADVMLALRRIGEQAKARGRQPSHDVLELADIARTALIRERSRQEQPKASESEGDAAA